MAQKPEPEKTEEEEEAEEETEFEQALVLTQYGKFQYELIAITGMIYLNTAMAITILSFVLPAATCDYDMKSTDKGWLTASPMLGMLVGSYFWGCLADTKGRKTVLVSTLIFDGICGMMSSFLPYYSLFVGFKFFNGFNVAGTMSIVFAYLGEFQPSSIREQVLCWMEMFWTAGVIILPCVAWLVIPLDLDYHFGEFFFHSWNLFVLVLSSPSLLLGLWLIGFPESPKFLWEQGDTLKALEVLGYIFARNTGRDVSEYPVSILKHNTPRRHSTTTLRIKKPIPHLSITKKSERRILFRQMWKQTKRLCRKPHLRNTILTCVLQFGLTASYYTLMVWFPELFHRYQEYEETTDIEASVCELSSYMANVVKNTTNIEEVCNDDIESIVFLHTLYLGIACIPTSLMLPIFVHRLGVKCLLAFGLIASSIVTVALIFVQNSTQNMIASCVFESLTSYTISTVYIIMVDLFPTNLRVMAAALSMTFGRGGALLGNLMFGFLVDVHCVASLLIFAALLLICGIVSFFIPTGIYA